MVFLFHWYVNELLFYILTQAKGVKQGQGLVAQVTITDRYKQY